MNLEIDRRGALRAVAASSVGLGMAARSVAQTGQPAPVSGARMQAKGTFDVKLPNQPVAPGTEAAQLGRKAIHKTFQGELQASSLGEMLAAGTATPGSAGYVAMERVEGQLAGRRGAFVLMHFGVMDRGQPSLTIRVVPDSGTEALQGLTGSMQIDIRDGQHFYTLDYQLPAG